MTNQTELEKQQERLLNAINQLLDEKKQDKKIDNLFKRKSTWIIFGLNMLISIIGSSWTFSIEYHDLVKDVITMKNTYVTKTELSVHMDKLKTQNDNRDKNLNTNFENIRSQLKSNTILNKIE